MLNLADPPKMRCTPGVFFIVAQAPAIFEVPLYALLLIELPTPVGRHMQFDVSIRLYEY
jgi:hypothetical protein